MPFHQPLGSGCCSCGRGFETRPRKFWNTRSKDSSSTSLRQLRKNGLMGWSTRFLRKQPGFDSLRQSMPVRQSFTMTKSVKLGRLRSRYSFKPIITLCNTEGCRGSIIINLFNEAQAISSSISCFGTVTLQFFKITENVPAQLNFLSCTKELGWLIRKWHTTGSTCYDT